MSVLSLLPDDKKKDFRKESLTSVYSSNSRLNLLNKRKRVCPLLDMSGKDNARAVTQRVLSAKAHRVKQLQNQLADAHYHLQELSNENRILRAMQKKQEVALQRYEGSSAELPTVLSSHSEEIRIQQAKYKQLKKQLQEVQQKLKERDMQLQQLRDEHNHLLELTRDRNLLEREKLQQTVTDLSSKVQQQNEQISILQRRLVLEQKNFRHQLQNEINKHKDTRHDLDLAINNADKLSTIIEMKEKMLSTAAGRNMRSPPKSTPSFAPRPANKVKSNNEIVSRDRDRDRGEERGDRAKSGDPLMKICETSRNLSSVLSYDEEMSSTAEPRSRYVRSRTNSNPKKSPKSSRNPEPSDGMLELAKTVQDGMADLNILDDYDEKSVSPDEMQKQIDKMKQHLMTKIKTDGDDKNDNTEGKYIDKPMSRKPSFIRRQSTEESIEEVIEGNEIEPYERPKSRGRRNSSVSFSDTLEETTTTVTINDYRTGDEMALAKPSRVGSGVDRKIGGKPIEKYCREIMHDIEKSTKVIDKHMRQFNHCQFETEKLADQIASVDKMNNFLNASGDIPSETLQELNNNFRMLTESAMSEIPAPRKRSISGRRNSRIESKSVLDDGALTNQDLLNDLLGRK